MKNLFFVALIMISASAFSQLKAIRYSDGSQKLNGLLAAPAKNSPGKAGVLILPAWKGIDAHSKDSAEKLRKMGYFAFVADIYGEGNYPKDTKEAGEKSGYYKTNYKEYQKRISLALDELVKAGADPGNIAIIGYCFGGTGAIEAARANLPVRGIVSFHGGLGKDAQRETSVIKPKVLVCHGADDPFVPQADITSFQDEMRKADADWQMVYYADSVHSFTDPEAGNDNSKGAAYNALADKRSWEMMKSFFAEILK